MPPISRPLVRSLELDMPGFLMMLYGVVTYVFSFATFLFMVGFVGDLPLPKRSTAALPGLWPKR